MEQFFRVYQKELLEFANSSIGNYALQRLGQRVQNIIVVITPDSFHEATPIKNTYRATFFPKEWVGRILLPEFRKYREYARWKNQTFHHTQIYQSTTFNPVAGAVSPCDGTVLCNIAQPGVAFSTLVGDAGTAANVTNASGNIILLQSASSGSGYVEIDRSVFNFNTASLSANANISAAVLSLYSNGTGNTLGGTPNARIVAATPASPSTLATSDYSNFGTTQLAALLLSGITTSAYNDFATSNIIATVNKTGITSFGVRLDWDANNSFTGSYTNGASTYWNVNMADAGANIPKLVVTYTLPGANFAAFL